MLLVQAKMNLTTEEQDHETLQIEGGADEIGNLVIAEIGEDKDTYDVDNTIQAVTASNLLLKSNGGNKMPLNHSAGKIGKLDNQIVPSLDVIDVQSQQTFGPLGNDNNDVCNTDVSLRNSSAVKGEIRPVPPMNNVGSRVDFESAQNQASNSLHQCPRAVYWYEKSVAVYIIGLAISLLINGTPLVILSILIRNHDVYSNSECEPFKALSLSLCWGSFGLNLSILLVYGGLIYKYRNNKWIKMKTSWYLVQSLPSLEIPIIYLATTMRLLDNFFISGAVARQRILYIIFVKSSRRYTKRQLLCQQFATIFALLALNIVFELPYLIYWSRYDEVNLTNQTVKISALTYGLQFAFSFVLMFIFFYYAYITRIHHRSCECFNLWLLAPDISLSIDLLYKRAAVLFEIWTNRRNAKKKSPLERCKFKF
eukprot:Awhi_evm1s3817